MEEMDTGLQLRLFRAMLRIRMVEEAIADHYAEQQMRCPVHLSIGQEGVAVGVCAALRNEDEVMSTHRAHAHYLAKGGDLRRMFAEIYGKESGCAKGRGGSMHLIDRSVNMLGATPIVGSSIPVAVGFSFASWLRDDNAVSVVFFGEGATEEGSFAESLNFAALKKLPMLFICENNFYSVYSPLDVRQPEARDRVAIARAHGIYGDSGNGNAVEEVFARTQSALAHIGSNNGPAYIEFTTYRWREHCGPGWDNHIGYRSEAEYNQWRERCPVETYQRILLKSGALHLTQVEEMQSDIRSEIEDAICFAKESPFPSSTDLLNEVYS